MGARDATLPTDNRHNLGKQQRVNEKKAAVLEWLRANPEASAAAAAAEVEVTGNTLSAWAKKDEAFAAQYRELLRARDVAYLKKVNALASTTFRTELVSDADAAKEDFLRTFEQTHDAREACLAVGRSQATIRAWSTPSHVSYDKDFAERYALLKMARLDYCNEDAFAIAEGRVEADQNRAKMLVEVLRNCNPEWAIRQHTTVAGTLDITAHTSPEARVAAAGANQELIMSGSSRSPDYKRRPNDLGRLLG